MSAIADPAAPEPAEPDVAWRHVVEVSPAVDGTVTITVRTGDLDEADALAAALDVAAARCAGGTVLVDATAAQVVTNEVVAVLLRRARAATLDGSRLVLRPSDSVQRKLVLLGVAGVVALQPPPKN
ncbi:hypothetical protein [Amycolatopsis plumensis]|uniref:STAS domain-containing protein n=1 Tax=Amycolatopsis plumensis TaxID=236508 RepID=A0ABV5UFE9_9PSEU